MAFFISHLQRQASDRKRATSLDTIVQHRRSESSSSRKPSVLSSNDEETSIENEVEQLFQESTDAAAERDIGHGSTKTETSLFLRFMKRKDLRSASTAVPFGLKRTFLNWNHPSTYTMANGDASQVVRSSTTDVISETGYDSDARFISSPRFSDQSWGSFNTSSPIQIELVGDSMTPMVPGNKQSQEVRKASDIGVLPSPDHRQSYVLTLPKRRIVREVNIEESCHSCPLQMAGIVLNNDGLTTKDSLKAVAGLRKGSRFTEVFNHVGSEAESSHPQPRKVSIGWMSEGKRYGYGYSFVDGEETSKNFCDTDVPTHDSCEAGATSSGKEDSISNGNRHNHQASLSEHYELHQIQAVTEANTDIETANVPNKRTRWTAFPSQTKVERNQSFDIDDGIIVRDFCTKASPCRPQHSNGIPEGKRRYLISNAVRQGCHDTFLWLIGLKKREIARYHAGLEVQAALSHDHVDPKTEAAVPYWDHVPKEELGDYHIEALRAATRRTRHQRRKYGKFMIAIGGRHAARSSSLGAMEEATHNTASGVKLDVQERFSSKSNGDPNEYVGRRHSSTF